MGRSKKPQLPFDKRGGTIVFSRVMLESAVYETMPSPAKCLISLLQMQWRNDRQVSYSVREAAKRLGISNNTACKAFDILQERGFIICAEESLFNSRGGSKARDWVLTWMPYNDMAPTNNWENWNPEKATEPSVKINHPYQNDNAKSVCVSK